MKHNYPFYTYRQGKTDMYSQVFGIPGVVELLAESPSSDVFSPNSSYTAPPGKIFSAV